MPLRRIQHAFSLDRRSIGLSRICVALVMICDLLSRARFLEEHYCDNGLLPRDLVIREYFYDTWFSIYNITGTWTGVSLLFVIHGLIAGCLCVGYHCRISCFAAWIFTISLQSRNIVVLHGGDTLLRLALFFMMFLPLDEFSLDRYRSRGGDSKGRNMRQCSPATIAWIIMIIQMYYWNFMNKNGPAWHEDGTASFYALQMEFFQLPLARLLLAVIPSVMFPLSTWGVMAVEGVGWLLFISPWCSDRLRLLGVFVFAMMHATFGLTLAIGMFAFVTIAVVLSLLPSLFWEYASRWQSRVPIPSSYYYLPQRHQPPQPTNSNWSEMRRSLSRSTCALLSSKRVKKVLRNGVKLLPLMASVWTIAWCISTYSGGFMFFPPGYALGTGLHLDPRWEMFAPQPPIDDSQIIIAGTFVNGTRVDLFSHQAMRTKTYTPLSLTATSREEYQKDILAHRWMKYYESLTGHSKRSLLQVRLLQWMCERWRTDTEQPFHIVSLYVGTRPFPKPFQRREEPAQFSQVQLVRSYECHK